MIVNPISNPVSINSKGANEVKSPEQQQLYKACTEFEAMLVKQLLETMQSSTQMFGKGFGGDYFQSMFQDQLSQQIAADGMGLARTLYAQMIKTMNVK